MRAEDLRTKRQVLSAFASTGSGRVIGTACASALLVRLLLGDYSWLDGLIIALSVVLVGVVEWVIHLFLLHAPLDSFRMRTLKTGTGHREHHLDPGHLGWLLLGTVDVVVFVVLIAAGTLAWTSVIFALIGAVVGGAPIVGPAVTGVLAALVLLGHYEWTHLLVHTRYRPRTPYYQRLARNHRLHHYRNERYWLGVTSNLGDRVLGSYPAHRSDVPLSATARTLETAP